MEKQIPQFLKDLLIEQYGEEISAKIENGYKAQRPVTLRVNNLKTSFFSFTAIIIIVSIIIGIIHIII